jgi:voltage-gated potassium channel
MFRRIKDFLDFNRTFLQYALGVRETLVSLILLLAVNGVLLSKLEHIPFRDAIYFVFITGLTIGYGDIVPHTAWGRVISISSGLIGVIFVGLTVAIATRALATHHQKSEL